MENILLELQFTEPAPHLNKLTQAHDPAYQITPKIEATYDAIKLISTHANRVHKHCYYLSPALRTLYTSCNFNTSKYSYSASQIPIIISLAKRNTNQCKQSFQNRNGKYLAKQETHFT